MAVTVNIPTEVSQTITDGVTNKAPSENAVFDGLGLKVDKSNTEGERLSTAFTPIYAWGDSLTAGSGGTPFPTTLGLLTNFVVTNKGIGGETSTQIKDRLVADVANYSKSVIIWAGRNNYTDPATVKADIATMISTIGHTRYLVVGVINGEYASEYSGGVNHTIITQLNSDLATLYGDKYVEIREYLVSLQNGSAQDLIDFGHDIVPLSLRSDNIHLNTTGYTRVAEFLNQRLGVLYNQTEYLQSKDLQYYDFQNSIARNPAARQETTEFYIGGRGRLNHIITQIGTLANNNASHHLFQTNFSNRAALALTALETGSNSGSNLSLITYTDAGAVSSNSFTLFRATNNIVLQNSNILPTDNGIDRLQIIGSLVAQQLKVSTLNTAPASATATGTLGEIRITADYIYICTAANTWKRTALTTW